jgi:hypothetical protein
MVVLVPFGQIEVPGRFGGEFVDNGELVAEGGGAVSCLQRSRCQDVPAFPDVMEHWLDILGFDAAISWPLPWVDGLERNLVKNSWAMISANGE